MLLQKGTYTDVRDKKVSTLFKYAILFAHLSTSSGTSSHLLLRLTYIPYNLLQDGNTALHDVIYTGDIEIAQLLLLAGADPLIKNKVIIVFYTGLMIIVH